MGSWQTRLTAWCIRASLTANHNALSPLYSREIAKFKFKSERESGGATDLPLELFEASAASYQAGGSSRLDYFVPYRAAPLPEAGSDKRRREGLQTEERRVCSQLAILHAGAVA